MGFHCQTLMQEREVDMEQELIYRLTVSLQYLVLYSIMIERSLQLVFDWSIYKEKLDGKGLSMPIALATSGLVSWFTGFDILAYISGSPEVVHWIGYPITALLLAQGSKIGAQVWGDLREVDDKTR